MLIAVVMALLFAVIFSALESIGSPISGVFASILGGLFVNFLYILGGAQQTAEYWHDTGPGWMRFVKQKLYKQNITIRTYPLLQKRNINKALSLALGVAFFVVIGYSRGDYPRHYWWIELIILLTISILGIFLSEWYFRRKFTRMDGVDF